MEDLCSLGMFTNFYITTLAQKWIINFINFLSVLAYGVYDHNAIYSQGKIKFILQVKNNRTKNVDLRYNSKIFYCMSRHMDSYPNSINNVTSSTAYGTRRFNAEFTRTLQ